MTLIVLIKMSRVYKEENKNSLSLLKYIGACLLSKDMLGLREPCAKVHFMNY